MIMKNNTDSSKCFKLGLVMMFLIGILIGLIQATEVPSLTSSVLGGVSIDPSSGISINPSKSSNPSFSNGLSSEPSDSEINGLISSQIINFSPSPTERQPTHSSAMIHASASFSAPSNTIKPMDSTCGGNPPKFTSMTATNWTCDPTTGRYRPDKTDVQMIQNSSLSMPASVHLSVSSLSLDHTSTLDFSLNSSSTFPTIHTDHCFYPKGRLILRMHFHPTIPTFFALITWNSSESCQHSKNIRDNNLNSTSSESDTTSFDSISIINPEDSQSCQTTTASEQYNGDSFGVLLTPVDSCDKGQSESNNTTKILVGVLVGIFGGLIVIVIMVAIILALIAGLKVTKRDRASLHINV